MSLRNILGVLGGVFTGLSSVGCIASHPEAETFLNRMSGYHLGGRDYPARFIGRPVYVSENGGSESGFSVILEEERERYRNRNIFAYTVRGNEMTTRNAVNMIRNEINDGDEEPIRIISTMDSAGNQVIKKIFFGRVWDGEMLDFR